MCTHKGVGAERKREIVLSRLYAEPGSGLDLTTLISGPEPKPSVRGLTDCITQGTQRDKECFNEHPHM